MLNTLKHAFDEIVHDLKTSLSHQYQVEPEYELIPGFDGSAVALRIDRNIEKHDNFFHNNIFMKAAVIEELTKTIVGVDYAIFAPAFVVVGGEDRYVKLKAPQDIEGLDQSMYGVMVLIDENETHYKITNGTLDGVMDILKEEVEFITL